MYRIFSNKTFLILSVAIVLIQSTYAQEQISQEERMAWWENARFGMFIHWGVYSDYGGEWNGTDYGKDTGGPSAEWIYLTADIPKKEYEKKAFEFNPVNYDPEEWVRLAKEAGMKYMVLTAKHHDGFALFDTRATDWNIVKSSTYKKDIIKAYVDECHKQGMRVGLYYSHEKDWYNHKKVRRDTSAVSKDYTEIVRTHLKELLTNYGQIDLIWFDMGINQHRELNQMCYYMVREYQPRCIISSRIGNGLGDYKNLGDRELASPETEGYVESIMTLRLNWGYDKNDNNWKSAEEVISMLSKCACRNSNFLLNMGPQPDGRFTPEEMVRLKAIGRWVKKNGDAIYGAEGSPFKGEYHWGSVTIKEKNLFLHLYNWDSGAIQLTGIKNKVNNAQMMDDATPVIFKQDSEKITISIPQKEKNKIVPVIVLGLENELDVNINDGPTWLPPKIKHITRKEVTGLLISADGNVFSVFDGEKEVRFELNEDVEYRINDKGNISIVNGYHPEKGKNYRIIYSPWENTIVEIITLLQ
ncbi:MAG: alpha-L-fucosidase [Bacteroidota bacterium]